MTMLPFRRGRKNAGGHRRPIWRWVLVCGLTAGFGGLRAQAQDDQLNKVHVPPPGTATPSTAEPNGAEAPAANDVKSPETYVGYDRAENFVSPGGMHGDVSRVFVVPRHIGLNQWGLAGKWTDRAEGATLDQAPGRIVYRFHARDLHLAPGPGKNGTAIRFRVTLDGHPLAEDHGADTDEQGAGRVTEQRL